MQHTNDIFSTHLLLQEVYRENYGHQLIKRLWMDGKFSNVRSLQDLPAKVFCPMDKDTWGEIFERELSR